jgi:hypothetical protein
VKQLELTKSEIATIVTMLHMGGWHRKKNLPKHIRESNNSFVNRMSKILKKLETALDDDD